MVAAGMPLYGDGMTSADLTSSRVPAAVGALWSAPTRRATGNALAALLAALVGGVLLGGLAVIWVRRGRQPGGLAGGRLGARRCCISRWSWRARC